MWCTDTALKAIKTERAVRRNLLSGPTARMGYTKWRCNQVNGAVAVEVMVMLICLLYTSDAADD